MSANVTETSDGEPVDPESETNRAVSTIAKRSRDGTLATLAGAALLAWALKTARNRTGRAALPALSGAALLGIGTRQRRTERRGGNDVDTGSDARRDEEGEKRVSDEAHAERTRDLGAQRTADESASVYQSDTEPNPRGMSDRSDVETGSDVQDDGGGDIDFVEGEEPGAHRETHLEDEDAHDPRLHPESDDEPTEIDLSEAAMADEASEATGPHPEQAYPAREGTDPEPTSDRAPERVGEGAVASASTDAEERRSGEGSPDRDDEPGEHDDEPGGREDERGRREGETAGHEGETDGRDESEEAAEGSEPDDAAEGDAENRTDGG